MRVKLITTISLIFCFSIPTFAVSGKLPCKVVNVIDGNNVIVLANKKRLNVRLAYIDAPVKPMNYGERAKRFLSSLVLNKKVIVVYQKVSKHERKILGEIFLDKKNMNLEMVKNGMATWYQSYAKERTDYGKAQTYAKDNKLGLWGEMMCSKEPWNKALKNIMDNKSKSIGTENATE